MIDKAAVIKQAQKYLEKGQIDKAIAEWETLAKGGRDAGVFNTLGDLYLKKGDKKSAIEYFHKSAEFLRGEGFSMKASALYKKVVNIDPSDVDALIALGELNDEKQLATDAVKYFLSAADILSKSADKEKLVKTYEKILALSPFNIPLREKIAELFLKEGLPSNAIREHAYLARLHEEKGDHEKAKDYFRRIVNIQPGNKEALIGLSYIYEKAGDIGNAIKYTREAVNACPGAIDILLRHAGFLKDTGGYDEAVSCLSKIMESKPDDVPANILMGDVCFAKGDNEQAWKFYKTAVDLLAGENKIEDALAVAQNSKYINPVKMGKLLASLYRQKGDTQSALREMIIIADMLSDNGFYSEAIEYYRDALRINPDDRMLLEKLSSLQGMAAAPAAPSISQLEEAVTPTHASMEIKEGPGPQKLESDLLDIFEEFKRGLENEIEAEDSETHYNLGIAYREMGLTDDAIKEFHTSKSDPKRYVQSMTMLGLCYMEKELFSAAIEAFDGALPSIKTRDDSYREIQYNLALAYEGSGDIGQAIELFRELHDWKPQFKDIAERLNRLKDMVPENRPQEK